MLWGKAHYFYLTIDLGEDLNSIKTKKKVNADYICTYTPLDNLKNEEKDSLQFWNFEN